MMKLTAYLDETGHSKDEKIRFTGMAGLIAPTYYWEQYERKWNQALKEFEIPYFHMKEYAHSKGIFEGWRNDEPKRRALYGSLMNIISETCALPFGSIIPMNIFRRYTKEQQGYFKDPYYFAFLTCLVIAADLIGPIRPIEETMAMVFSDQSEFMGSAKGFYEVTKESHPEGARINPPVFRDMKKSVPLQGADIVAYELHKECDRHFYRPKDKQRWGYMELRRICTKSANFFPLIIHDEDTLGMHIRHVEDEFIRAGLRR
jgi:hypothetical protein